MTILAARKARLLVATSLIALGAHHAAFAEMAPAPGLNTYGVPGLLDMPSGEALPDGYLTTSMAGFGSTLRTTLSFQISPRLSASFRYTGVQHWNRTTGLDNQFNTYYDRSFDVRYQVLTEGRYMPAVTVGLQDFLGTGLLSAEYIAATKHLSPRLKLTGGLGWGRLGSYGDIGSPLGDRDPVDVGQGGKVNFGQWFRGPVAPFAGVEWQATDRLSLKAEYSSDAYELEDERRRTMELKNPFSFGAEYQVNENLRLGGYYMYGSEVGFSAQFVMNPGSRPQGNVNDTAPDPVKPRPSRAADPEAWSPEWVTQPDVGPVLIENLNKRLKGDGLLVEGIRYQGDTVRVTVRNDRYDAEAQVIGRVARAMTNVMPASVERFEIVPVVNGIPASQVALRRSDVERLEFAPDAAAQLRHRVEIGEADPLRGTGMVMNPDLYPRFRWNLGPYLRASLFDPEAPVRAELGARLTASFEVAPGQVLSTSIAQPLAGNLDKGDPPEPSDSPNPPPRVRSNVSLYDQEGSPAIEHLTWAWYAHPTPTIHTRITAGYLERMFGGVSAEVLWKRADSPFGLGAEINYVKQRDFDQLFGFQDYDTVTGHVSGYLEFAHGYHAQVDVGRYLAGDIGATLSLNREFDNGWKVGVFATKTDMSAEDFGEGSYDKGIMLSIPFTWSLGTPSRDVASTTLRSLSRDGGARLDVEGRLYETYRDYDTSGLDGQWGRFWK